MVTDNMADGVGSVGNYTWYRNIVSSSSKRIAKYNEYNLMDQDIEIARALDTIAEEMTGNADEADLPLLVEIQDDEAATMENAYALTLKAALTYWCEIHDWHNKLFKIARHTIKYGDCFFEKSDINHSWKFVQPKHVFGAIVHPEDAHDVQGWIMVNDPTKKTNDTQVVQQQEYVKKSNEVVRFTLNDDMNEMAPFGVSVLNDVYKTYQQKELLESSIIIYRIQRAPEKRVYYIDVGKMPPQRAKVYLEQMKNEIKSKKIPTLLSQNGQETMDSVYNPQSMVEDIFIAQRADGRGSKVETLAGGVQLGEITDLKYFQDKLWRGLRIPPSYMQAGQEGQAVYADGKVGVAYILELRFSLYIQRLQAHIEKVLDTEFKHFLRRKNIHVDDTQFKLKLPTPSNFGVYRRQELDSQLLNSFSQADNVPYISKRFALNRYLNLTDEEIALNDKMVREERGLDPDGGAEDMLQVYNPELAAQMAGAPPAGGGGGSAGGGAMPMGDMGFSEPDVGALGEPLPGEEGAEGAAPVTGGAPGAAATAPAGKPAPKGKGVTV